MNPTNEDLEPLVAVIQDTIERCAEYNITTAEGIAWGIVRALQPERTGRVNKVPHYMVKGVIEDDSNRARAAFDSRFSNPLAYLDKLTAQAQA